MADAGGLGSRIVIRREFLSHGLTLVSLFCGADLRLRRAALSGPPDAGLKGPRYDDFFVRSQGEAPIRYRKLPQPVLVPLADLATPRRARQFMADAMTLPSAAKPNQPIRITGMIARVAAGDNAPDRFRAVSVRCPHELCDVDFVADPAKLPPEVTAEIGHPLNEPAYVCPCHNSTFKMEDGERVAGPAPRGLYQFRVTAVTGAAVEIGEVEEDVLLFV